MTTIAIQISSEGVGWALMPDPLHMEADNSIEGGVLSWPRVVHPRRGQLPPDMEERVLGYAAAAGLLADTEAEAVILAVEACVDRIRVGIVEVALNHADVSVDVTAPHPDGAAGIMRAEIERLLSETARPPGP